MFHFDKNCVSCPSIVCKLLNLNLLEYHSVFAWCGCHYFIVIVVVAVAVAIEASVKSFFLDILCVTSLVRNIFGAQKDLSCKLTIL